MKRTWLPADLWAGPGLLPHSPVFEMCIPSPVSIALISSRKQPWENNALLSPSGQSRGLNLVKTSRKRPRFWRTRAKTYLSCSSQVWKLPWVLLALPPDNLQGSASLFSPCPLPTELSFEFQPRYVGRILLDVNYLVYCRLHVFCCSQFSLCRAGINNFNLTGGCEN